LGPLAVELVSHPDQERSLSDFDVLMARVKVRRDPVAVRHGYQEGELAGSGGIAGGSTGGTDHCSGAGLPEDCAMAPGAARNHTEVAMRTPSRRVTTVVSSIVPLLQ
jgi:hypothetical protein